ncbi:hypothetical protein PM082_020143 [Marasmius tenuissimus]|nr:hypothetical protein PM082_020143 [Marasmius tenuissimus]
MPILGRRWRWICVPIDVWSDVIQSLLSSTDENDALVEDILADELYSSIYSCSSQSRFIVEEAEEGEGRTPEDIQHLATVLAILLTHTINVTFDSGGVPYSCGASASKAIVKSREREREGPTTKDQSGIRASSVFSPPSTVTARRSKDAVHQRELFKFDLKSDGSKALHARTRLMIVPVEDTLRWVAMVG